MHLYSGCEGGNGRKLHVLWANTEITREVTVYPMQLPAAEMPQALYGWNPTIMQFVQFSIASDHDGEQSTPLLA